MMKMKKSRALDFLFINGTGLLAWSIVALSAVLVYKLAQSSMPSIHAFGWHFLVTSEWDAVKERFGVLPVIYGTLVSSLVALIIAVPLSLGIAIYLAELAPVWLKTPLGFIIELLAAIPSVIYGLWGIFVLVPCMRNSVQPFLGKYFGFLPFFQGPNHFVHLDLKPHRQRVGDDSLGQFLPRNRRLAGRNFL